VDGILKLMRPLAEDEIAAELLEKQLLGVDKLV
jgi:hypothetical protein